MSLLQVAKLPFLINDGKWHHLCITWTTRDGMWEAFQDGVMRGSGENLAPYHPIKPEGVLVLGQEQVIIHLHITEYNYNHFNPHVFGNHHWPIMRSVLEILVGIFMK